VSAVHRTRRRPFEVDPFAVITASVAWTLELVLAGLPVGRAAQMSAARVNDKDAIGRAVHPNAVFLLPLGIHAESIIRGIANLKNGGRFKERTRKEESKKSDEHTRRLRPSLAALAPGPTDATPAAAAAFDVPTAGVPT